MSMIRALAMMGSGAEGFVEGQRTADEEARKRSAEDFAQRQREFQVGEMQRTLQMRREMDAAGQPVQPQAIDSAQADQVQPQPDMDQDAAGGPMQLMVKSPDDDNRDVGEAGAAAPTPAMRVGDQGGLTPMQAATAAAQQNQQNQASSDAQTAALKAQAQRAADAQNTPEAVQARQIAVMRKYDPQAAMGMQAQSQAVLSAKMDLASKVWNNDILNATQAGLPAIVKLMNDSHADGMGGSVKVQANVSPDGQTFTISRLMPDGSMGTTSPALPNNAQGYEQLAQALYRLPPEQVLAHALAQQREAREGRLTDATVNYHNAQAEWFKARPDLEQGKIDAKGYGSSLKLPEEVKLQLQDLNKRLETVKSKYMDAIADSGKYGQPLDAKVEHFFNKQEALITIEREQLLAPYAKAQAPDPLGLRTGPDAASGDNPHKVSKATQAERDADKPALLAEEYLKPGTSQTDKSDLMKEIERLPAAAMAKAKAFIASGTTGRTPYNQPAQASAQAPAASPMVAAAAAAAPAPSKPFAPNAAMDALQRKEMLEMTDPRVNRMMYSPEVDAYVKAKRLYEIAADEKANADRSKRDFMKEMARRKAMGY